MLRESTGKGVRFAVSRKRARAGGGCLLIPFGAVFAGFALLFGTLAFTFGANQLDGFALAFIVPFLSIFVLVGTGIMIAGVLSWAGRAVVRLEEGRLRAGKQWAFFSFSRSTTLEEGGQFKVAPGKSRQEALAGAMRVIYEVPLSDSFVVAEGLHLDDARRLAEALATETGSRFIDSTSEQAVDDTLAAMDEHDQRLAQRRKDVELEPSTSRVAWRAFLLVGIAMDAVVVAIVGGTIVRGNSPSLPLWIFGGFFFLVGAGLTAAGIHRLMAEAKLGSPVVRISVNPLLLGESFSLAYRQPVKGGGVHEGVTVTLRMTERATYRRGTNTYTVTHHAFEQEVSLLPPGKLIPGQELAAETQLEIPTDSMHSFQQSNNEINWTIIIQTKIPRWPDYRSDYELRVLPRALVETGAPDTGDTTDGS